MSFTAWPTLRIAGELPATGDPAAPLAAVDELRITWGRDSELSTPTPSTAQVTLLDRSRGYTFASRRSALIGQPVTLGYLNDGAEYAGEEYTNFRGRITDAAVAPAFPDRPEDGMAVTLVCSSKEVELANYIAPRNPAGLIFPAETVSQRLGRIVGLLPAGFFTTAPAMTLLGGTTPPYTVAPADPAGTDVLSLFRQLYLSAGLTPYYDPALDGMSYVVRQRASVGVTARLGKKFDGTGPYTAYSQLGWFELHADQLEHDGAADWPMDSRVTRVELNYKNATATPAYAATTYAVAVAPTVDDETVVGRRPLTIDTLLTTAADAATVAETWRSLAGEEARRARLGPLTYSTARNPLDDYRLMRFLLGGVQRDAVFVRGSWLTRIGVRPNVGALGGTIRYAAGEWTVQFTPAAISWEGTPAPITPASLGASSIRLADIDPTLTVGDLGFIEFISP